MFFEQLTRIADHTKLGSDNIRGIVWRHVPQFLKVELYNLFIERIKECNWSDNTVSTWDNFELLGIKKTRSPRDFGDFR